MPLVFNGFELGGVLLAILIANVATRDGESNWFEGVQLLGRLRDPRDRLLLRLGRRTRWTSSSCSQLRRHPRRRAAVHQRDRVGRPPARARRGRDRQRARRGRHGDARDADPDRRDHRRRRGLRGRRGRGDHRRAVPARDDRDGAGRNRCPDLPGPPRAGGAARRRRPDARPRPDLLPRLLRARHRRGAGAAGAAADPARDRLRARLRRLRAPDVARRRSGAGDRVDRRRCTSTAAPATSRPPARSSCSS